MGLRSDEVAAAVAAWTWVPDYARAVEPGDATLIRYPDHFDVPLVARLGPMDTDGLAGVLDRVLATARTLDHPWVAVQVPLGAPAELEALLADRGADVLETLDVLAADPRDVDTGVAGDLTVRTETETDLDRAYDDRRVATAVFGGSLPSPEFVRREVVGADARREAGEEWRGVAYDGDRAVGSAGCTLVDGVARLWGGAVLPDARGRGAYRALLAARVAWAVGHQARMALVKGRVESSGPILRRAGFAVHGTVRDWRVEL